MIHSHFFKDLSRDQAGIIKLRSWATLYEVRDLATDLLNVYDHI